LQSLFVHVLVYSMLVYSMLVYSMLVYSKQFTCIIQYSEV